MQINKDALNETGYCLLTGLLSPSECQSFVNGYDDDQRYRSTVAMARHGFGQGEYRYFSYPLPDRILDLRNSLYPALAEIANEWTARMGVAIRYPAVHQDYLKRCHQNGQERPTPLILRYGEGDYNCLHQDLYGEMVFPLQVAILLSRPETDFEGGEFILTEQRARMQSRAEVIPLKQGDAVVFPVNHQPKKGKRGDYRVTMRHGVSRIRSGQRHALGVIFHDAK
ncbi:2OG-Fe(II) oxygenase [Aestuariispira insulae]|uniref:2OG-Fe(II) oxygenase n=1 Tax=Aestuariispira insulae TaxID=1461337 RepID=UPI001FE48C73|nr:2OG-Fe(II) oxygenase [Aestuariispira insulae]